jgi:integrase
LCRHRHNHDLRHTHATLALKAGVPVKVISERLGHESPAFTLKQYAHVIPGMQAEAAAQVANLVDKTALDV